MIKLISAGDCLWLSKLCASFKYDLSQWFIGCWVFGFRVFAPKWFIFEGICTKRWILGGGLSQHKV